MANPNAAILGQLRVPGYNCPSSPMPTTHSLTNPVANTTHTVQLINYVGIAGHVTNPTTGVTTPDSTFGAHASNGVMHYQAKVRMADITDGTTNTIVIGEQSGWSQTAAGAQVDRRSCSHTGAGSWGSGGSGTTAPSGTSAYSGWTANVTSLRYAIGQKVETTIATGYGSGYSANNPLLSAHEGGVHVLRADGSVAFLSESISNTIVQCLAIRNDGQVVGEY